MKIREVDEQYMIGMVVSKRGYVKKDITIIRDQQRLFEESSLQQYNKRKT